MKIPITVNCLNGNCKKETTFFINIHETEIKGLCSHCGFDISGDLVNVTKGLLLLGKSGNEFKTNKDYSMCIILAALAFECDCQTFILNGER